MFRASCVILAYLLVAQLVFFYRQRIQLGDGSRTVVSMRYADERRISLVK